MNSKYFTYKKGNRYVENAFKMKRQKDELENKAIEHSDKEKFMYSKDSEFNFSPYFYLKLFPEYVEKVYIEYDNNTGHDKRSLERIHSSIKNEKSVKDGVSLFTQKKKVEHVKQDIRYKSTMPNNLNKVSSVEVKGKEQIEDGLVSGRMNSKSKINSNRDSIGVLSQNSNEKNDEKYQLKHQSQPLFQSQSQTIIQSQFQSQQNLNDKPVKLLTEMKVDNNYINPFSIENTVSKLKFSEKTFSEVTGNYEDKNNMLVMENVEKDKKRKAKKEKKSEDKNINKVINGPKGQMDAKEMKPHKTEVNEPRLRNSVVQTDENIDIEQETNLEKIQRNQSQMSQKNPFNTNKSVSALKLLSSAENRMEEYDDVNCMIEVDSEFDYQKKDNALLNNEISKEENKMKFMENLNDFIDQIDIENSAFFVTKTNKIRVQKQQDEEVKFHENSIKYNSDPTLQLPNSVRKYLNFVHPKTAGARIKYYPPENNLHEENMKKKNANFKKLNNHYSRNVNATNVDKFEFFLNKDLGKISHSYGRLETLKKFTQRPRTNIQTFNRIGSFDKYSALKQIENIDLRAKLRPLTNFKNHSLEKLGRTLFDSNKRVQSTKIVKLMRRGDH